MTRWIYLSPHFDDIVLSCGGLIWEQVKAGYFVEVWTVCAGQPTNDSELSDFARQLHQRWQTGPEAVLVRRQEDEAAVRHLGAAARYWDLPDCIYRRLPGGQWVVNGEEDLWVEVHPQEEPVIERLCAWIIAGLQPGDVLVSPLALGNHVDHRLVRAAAERVAKRTGCRLGFYADYPYAVKLGVQESAVPKDCRQECRPVSEEALHVWQAAVACYNSQISTFWGSIEEMRAAIEAYWRADGGSCLWHNCSR